MKISSARFHSVPTSGVQFLVTRSELRSAVDECLRNIRAQLLGTAFTELLDGGPWIWERVQQLCDEVGFDNRNLVEIVDFYHAKERLHAFAAEVKSWSKAQRDKWLKNATKLLQSGRIDALLGLCSEHYRGCNSKKRRKLAEYEG